LFTKTIRFLKSQKKMNITRVQIEINGKIYGRDAKNVIHTEEQLMEEKLYFFIEEVEPIETVKWENAGKIYGAVSSLFVDPMEFDKEYFVRENIPLDFGYNDILRQLKNIKEMRKSLENYGKEKKKSTCQVS
jgi:hypothetical protein